MTPTHGKVSLWSKRRHHYRHSRRSSQHHPFANPRGDPRRRFCFGGNEQSRLLKDASKYAQQQSKIQLGTNWLNNATTLFVPRALQAQLVQDAILQNVVLFQEQGLTVLAAPWSYALCGKTNRMSGPDQRPYDDQDAVACLHEYILSNSKKPLESQEKREWGKKYDKMVTIDALRQINNMYKQSYGQDGITF